MLLNLIYKLKAAFSRYSGTLWLVVGLFVLPALGSENSFVTNPTHPKRSLFKGLKFKKSVPGTGADLQAPAPSKIRRRPKPLNLREKIQKHQSGHSTTNIFDTTLFDFTKNTPPSSTLMWMHDPEILQRRAQITGSQPTILETWWNLSLDEFYVGSEASNNLVFRARPRVKFFTEITDFLYGRAELQFLTVTGSIQQIFTSTGDINGISQREILLLLMANNWLTFKFGVINQKFLNSPLLLGDIPFMSVVEDLKFITWKGRHSAFSLSLQQAIPNTFSADDRLLLDWTDGKLPFLFTSSVFFEYDPKSYYRNTASTTLFHFQNLPGSVAAISKGYGNSTMGDTGRIFRYPFTGLYLTWGNYLQMLPNVGLNLTLHYLWNFRAGFNYNQGILFKTEVPMDLTENLKLTFTGEYFINQKDSSVAAYSSERYGHNNRNGFNGEMLLDIFKRNVQMGFRYHYSRPVVQSSSVKRNETYFLLFVRTNYAKI